MNSLLELVKAQRPALREDALAIWDLAELGFQEYQSSALLQNRLRDAGFTVFSHAAGMPTAFAAGYKNGTGPVIALLAEYDALPGLSQSPSPEREAVPGKDNGHGCGHNLIGAAAAASAISLRRWMEERGIGGEVRLYGCPAEEGGAGKVYLVREGFFKDVDAVIHWHPTSYNGYYTSPHLATVSGRFRFHGTASHAAAAPELGRSALDGAMLMNMAVEFMREHVPEKTRIHYVISNGGSAANIVPDFAEVSLTVRHPDPVTVKALWNRIIAASRGAAAATETAVDHEISSGTYPLLINRTLIDAASRVFSSLRLPAWDEEQMGFAQAIARTLEKPGDLNPLTIQPPYPAAEVNASTDVGDISWVVPTVGIFAMSWVPGTAAHSWQSTAASGSSLGIQGAGVAAEVIALTAAELFLNPGLLEQAWREREEALGENFIYEPLLGNREPDLDYLKRH